MRAVVIEVNVSEVDRDAGIQRLREWLVPSISRMPGFLSGTWLTGNEHSVGLSLTIWDSEKSAQAFADQFGIGASPQAAASVVRCELREVAATANAASQATPR